MNVYAYHDAMHNASQLMCTQSLFAAIEEEVMATPELPTVILGDMNVTPDRIDGIRDRLAQGSLVDLGALRSINGGGDPLPTCRAHNAQAATRRDFVLWPASIIGV
eukprot:5260935-Alexandrium_andersonii.AAC.1